MLGRRHGQERQRTNPYAGTPSTPARAEQDNVIALPERTSPAGAPNGEDGVKAGVDATLAQIAIADPSFDARHFLNGAKSAFAIIVKAFAEGDTAALRPLLSDEIYETFARDIQTRQASGETLTTEIHSVVAEILEAQLQDHIAFITIRFNSSQSNVVRSANGEVTEQPETVNEIVDIWTFSRDTRSRDPNWLLVETRTS